MAAERSCRRRGAKTLKANGPEALAEARLRRRVGGDPSYLHDFRVAYVQRLGASAVQILHDQLRTQADS